MGEAADKIDRDDSHHKVVELRSQIEAKRAVLSAEFDELNRRRAIAVVKAKSGARSVGIAAVGLICGASLLNAIFDLFRNESADERKTNEGPPLIVTMATGALRWAAMQYLAKKFAEIKAEFEANNVSNDPAVMTIEETDAIVIAPM